MKRKPAPLTGGVSGIAGGLDLALSNRAEKAAPEVVAEVAERRAAGRRSRKVRIRTVD